MQKERFKIFVRNHPNLVKQVHNKKMTWQQFYELYDLYGEDDKIWDSFINENGNNDGDRSSNNINNSNNTNIANTLKDFMGLFKGIDLNTVQRTLTSIDKAIETFKGIGFNNQNNDGNRNTYEERPKYKYFED